MRNWTFGLIAVAWALGCEAGPVVDAGALAEASSEDAEWSLASGAHTPHESEIGHAEGDDDHVCEAEEGEPLSLEEAIEIGIVVPEEWVDDGGPEAGTSLPIIKVDFDLVELGEFGDSGAIGEARVHQATLFSKGSEDNDSDGLTNSQEKALGTKKNNPDSDGDGWFDGPMNVRRKLVLTKIKAHDEQEDIGKDELYLLVNDVRYPQSTLEDYWKFNHGDSKTFSKVIAERTQGTNEGDALQLVKIRGWEHDPEIGNTWKADDKLFSFELDLMGYGDGATFDMRIYEGGGHDWDYQLWFRVDFEYFADPSPLDADGDVDGDGISDASEFAVAEDFGGVVDPEGPDLLVEVDWMSGHPLNSTAKRLVRTAYARKGYNLRIYRDEKIATDSCLTRGEAVALQKKEFTYADYDAFRYAVIGKSTWAGKSLSGVASRDTFFVNDDKFTINGKILPQAGTFIHELGHTVGLTQSKYEWIDKTAPPSYVSAMNYLYQYFMADYATGFAGIAGPYHDDWADVNPAKGLKKKFAKGSTTVKDDACK